MHSVAKEKMRKGDGAGRAGTRGRRENLARPGLLVQRDLEIAAWLSRVGAASVAQVGARFGLGTSQRYRRVQILRSFGLLRRKAVLAGRPSVLVPTARSIRPASYEHALALTELIVSRELAGATILSELELRRESAEQRSFDDRLGEKGARTVSDCRRMPDAVELLDGEGELLAYEIELSSKGHRRREEIIRAYTASRYARVVWIVPDGPLRALIVAEVEAHGLGAFMEVRGDIGRR